MIRALLFSVLLLVVAVGVGQVVRDVLRRLGWGGAPGGGEEERGLLDALDHEIDTGDGIHETLVDAFGLERAGWATERVRRVEARLQVGRPPEARKRVEILWIPQVTAFTHAGPYVYLSRRLLERLATDDAVAWVVAHEMAHHDLGHFDALPDWATPVRALGGGGMALVLAFRVTHRMFGVERELEADSYALDLCLAAGYDAGACLRALDVLQDYMLDMGDVDGVFGPDAAHFVGVEGEDDGWNRARAAVWERLRGYPSIHDRRQALRARAAAYVPGTLPG